MSHNQRIGKWGEDTIAAYLSQRGHEIIARNLRTPYGEIDIMTRQGDITIFVEVKTRTSNKMGLPEESISSRKREHMLADADHYAAEHKIDRINRALIKPLNASKRTRLLAVASRSISSAEAYARALACSPNAAERRFIERRYREQKGPEKDVGPP